MQEDEAGSSRILVNTKKKRAPSDGGLRKLFFTHLKEGCQWTQVETWGVTGGVPDTEYCFKGGHQGWLELKQTSGWTPKIRPEQVAWISRRARMGGRVWVAVRRAQDELWLVPGSKVLELSEHGLRRVFRDSYVWDGGPSSWDWAAIGRRLEGRWTLD